MSVDASLGDAPREARSRNQLAAVEKLFTVHKLSEAIPWRHTTTHATQLLADSVRNVVMAFQRVAFVHVSDELPHVGGQQLVVFSTVWVSPTMSLIVFTWPAGTTHCPIYSSPVRAFPASVRFSVLL
jgi:hypothetical protein